MSYVDMAVGTAFFLFFLALVLIITIQYFVRYPAIVTVEEYREKSVDMFSRFFDTMGIPSDWENNDIAPSELGLVVKIRARSLLVREPGVSERQDEPVLVGVPFDEDCENKAWNNTVRIYDSNMTKVDYELVNPVFCSDHFLNESYVRLSVNVSKSGESTFFIFYHDDESIPGPNHTMSYSTSGWVPSDGDQWSESTSSWARYGGASGSAETNGTAKIMGDYSIQINGAFDSSALGLEYDPASNITGVSNGWYIGVWLYLDSLSGISAVNVSVNDNNDTIMASADSSELTAGEWYHFERELDSSEWDDWGAFNASNGIDKISVYMANSTSGITRQMKVDELHFGLAPLSVYAYPEETKNVVSSKKVSALRNLTYGELKESIGEDYRFRIEILD